MELLQGRSTATAKQRGSTASATTASARTGSASRATSAAASDPGMHRQAHVSVIYHGKL